MSKRNKHKNVALTWGFVVLCVMQVNFSGVTNAVAQENTPTVIAQNQTADASQDPNSDNGQNGDTSLYPTPGTYQDPGYNNGQNGDDSSNPAPDANQDPNYDSGQNGDTSSNPAPDANQDPNYDNGQNGDASSNPAPDANQDPNYDNTQNGDASNPAPDANQDANTNNPPDDTANVDYEQQCYNMVQGQVAWDLKGHTKWRPVNVKKLCRGTTDPTATIACFQDAIQAHKGWGRGIRECANQGGAQGNTDGQASANYEQQCYNMVQGHVAWNRRGTTKWNPGNVKKLCWHTQDPQSRIACFEEGIRAHNNWGRAIKECQNR